MTTADRAYVRNLILLAAALLAAVLLVAFFHGMHEDRFARDCHVSGGHVVTDRNPLGSHSRCERLTP